MGTRQRGVGRCFVLREMPQITHFSANWLAMQAGWQWLVHSSKNKQDPPAREGVPRASWSHQQPNPHPGDLE